MKPFILITLPALVIMAAIFSGACNDRTGIYEDTPIAADRTEESWTLDEYEATMLEACKSAWEKLASDTHEGKNYRRFQAGLLRIFPLDQALIAYWQINNSFPSGDVESGIRILEENKLLPFWPVDPDSREKVVLVNSAEDIYNYPNLYIESGFSGAFNFALLDYSWNDAYSQSVQWINSSERLSNMSRFHMVPEEVADQVRDPGPFETPSDPAEVFAGMIQTYFVVMMDKSFRLRNAEIATSLEELMESGLSIHPAGWGHPAGIIEDGAVGDFEYGIDPDLNGYYVEWVSGRNGKVFLGYKFVKTELNGEFVYSIAGPTSLLKGARESEFTNRIPLLTDDMFSEPPPDL